MGEEAELTSSSLYFVTDAVFTNAQDRHTQNNPASRWPWEDERLSGNSDGAAFGRRGSECEHPS